MQIQNQSAYNEGSVATAGSHGAITASGSVDDRDLPGAHEKEFGD